MMSELQKLLQDYQQRRNQTHNNRIKLALLFKDVRTDNIAELLQSKSQSESVLHIAAAAGHDHLLNAFLSRLPEQRRFDLLVSFKPTPLHAAVSNGKAESAESILQQLSFVHRVELINLLDKQGSGAGTSKTIEKYSEDVNSVLHRFLTEANKSQNLVQEAQPATKNLEDLKEMLTSYISDKKSQENEEFVRRLTGLLSDVRSDSLLAILQSRRRWSQGDSALHIAARAGHTKFITTVLSQLSVKQRSELLTATVPSPLHVAALHNKPQSVSAILNPLTPGEQIEILELKDHHKNLAINLVPLNNGDISTAQLLSENWKEAQKLDVFYCNMTTELENTVQGACERLEQTINNSVQGSITAMARKINDLEDSMASIQKTLADLKTYPRIAMYAQMLARHSSTQGSRVLQLSYDSRPNSYDNPGHLDENRNSSKNQQRNSAAVPENDIKKKGSASRIRRSFSFDSAMTHCSLACGKRFLLRRQPCLCSIRDSGEVIVLKEAGDASTYVIQDSEPEDKRESLPNQGEGQRRSAINAQVTFEASTNTGTTTDKRTASCRQCGVWEA